ncbi:zinc finger CHC2-family protein [Pseudomonas poae RE*1-1-14]|nr:zinc finger CHC2-family protein [Pseudomonas poae RE*1-1-14]
MRQQLQTLGVLRSTGHEHLNGCLVVPVLGLEDGAQPEQSGRVMQLYGRRMQPNNKIPANQSRHMYLATPLRGVWNEAALLASLEIILCESLIDAMTFWCAGFRNVISAYGVNGFSQDHWQALKHQGTQRVIIAFDRDSAGGAAAEKLAEELRSAGIEVFRLLFPQGMAANAFALQVENPAQALGELPNVRSAECRWREITEQKRQGPAQVSLASPLISMVPEPGIEPGRPYERGILSPMRLPVSPFGR